MHQEDLIRRTRGERIFQDLALPTTTAERQCCRGREEYGSGGLQLTCELGDMAEKKSEEGHRIWNSSHRSWEPLMAFTRQSMDLGD